MIDPQNLARHIKAARMLAEPPLLTAQEFADALTAIGCKTTDKKVWAWESGASVPTLTSFMAIVAVTAPQGGIKFFSGAWPTIWPAIEAGLNGGSGR